MSYRTSSIDLMSSVLDAMDFTVTIQNVVEDPAGTFTLTVCDVLHAEPGRRITIDGNRYTIASVDAPNTLVLSGEDAITAESFELYRPYFFFGTPIGTEDELEQEKNASNKTPMIWMMLPFQDRPDENPESAFDRELDVRLFFLTQADHEKWLTPDANEKAIQPMRRLEERYWAKVKQMISRFNVDRTSSKINDYPKFGVYLNGKSDKSLWADKLAGCESSITGLRIYHAGTCEQEC